MIRPTMRSIFSLVISWGIVMILLGASPGTAAKHNLRIQALIPQMNDVFSSDGVIPAMNMAVDDINANESLLSDYTLFTKISNTKCDAPEGTWQLIRSVLDTDQPDETKIIVYLGGACSLATEPTAALTGRLYKVVQMSYASTSPVLSDRSMYPLFFRTSPSELLFNDARFALMIKYQWCYVATLHETANIFSLPVQKFHDQFEDVLAGPGMHCNGTQENMRPVLFSFTKDPEIPLTQIQSKMIRIIFGLFYEDKVLVVMCYAKHMQLTNQNHLWIIPAWYADGWWKRADTFDWSPYKYECNSSDIMEAIEGSLLLDVYPYLLDDTTVSESNYTFNSFDAEYTRRRDQYFNITNTTDPSTIPNKLYTTLIYDALWSLAISLNRTDNHLQSFNISLRNFTYSDSVNNQPTLSSNISNLIADNLHKTDFVGVSGRVKFDVNGTRRGVIGIWQYVRDENQNLIKKRIGLYDKDTDNYTLNFTDSPLFKNNQTEPPRDVRQPESHLISPWAIYVMSVMICVGVIIAVGLLMFNIVTIRKPLMANSAPHINTIIIIGCIVMMATCTLLGIDSGTPQVTDGERKDILADITEYGKTRYAVICTVRLWLLTIGFTLSFGALFAKTWQVYRVYTTPALKDQVFKMWHFLIIMSVLSIIDVVLLSIWTGAFTFRHGIHNDPHEESDVIFQYEKCECENFPYLIGSLYVYKGLLVVFGLFLAYESRNVKYECINDSRFVSIAMYIVVILIGVGALLSLVLSDRYIIDAGYIIAVSMIVIACMCALLILYIPKFIYMAKGAETMIPKAKGEVFTPVDNLQLGHTDVNPEDLQMAEQEIKNLKEQVQKREMELVSLEQRRGSDQDSGLCTSMDEVGESTLGQSDSNRSDSPPQSNNNCTTTTTTMTTTDTTTTMDTTSSQEEKNKQKKLCFVDINYDDDDHV